MLDRQLLFVTGKGGVGRTTAAAALALAGAQRHGRVVVCEVAGQTRIPALLGAPAGRPGEEVRVGERVWATTIDPRRALEEWLARVLGSRSLTQLLARSNFFATFVAAVPGAAELVTLAKAWELGQAERWNRSERGYDLVIVDGPASGHGVGMLRTPRTFRDIARIGPIASQAERVHELLTDEARSAICAVALAGEMPVSETLELAGRLPAVLGRPLDAVVVNALAPRRFAAGEVEAVRGAADGRPDTDVRLAADAVRATWARATEQEEQVARLRAGVDTPVVELPFVAADPLGPEHVRAMSDALARDL